MKVIMDSDCLIKLTRAKAKEVVLRNVEAYIPPKVFEETVTIPKEEGYPDAFIIEDNQKNGLLLIEDIKNDQRVEEMVKRLGLGYGEADVFRLFKSGCFDIISSDDRRFIKIIDALDVPYITPTALITYLFNKKILNSEEAKIYINNLKEMISEEEYYLALREVE
jgi:hypothetical protein